MANANPTFIITLTVDGLNFPIKKHICRMDFLKRSNYMLSARYRDINSKTRIS